jgi:hypothetical protein
MGAIKFICKTDSKVNHNEIKNMTYIAGGAIVREKVYRDTSTVFESEMEIVSEGGTLYRQVKELEIGKSVHIIE